MEIETKLFHCRCCAEVKPYCDLLDLAQDEETYEEINTAVSYLNVTYLDLNDEILPKTICKKCYLTFIRSHKFFIKMKNSQKVLKDIYMNTVLVKDEADEFLVYENIENSDLNETSVTPQVLSPQSETTDYKIYIDEGKENQNSIKKLFDEPEKENNSNQTKSFGQNNAQHEQSLDNSDLENDYELADKSSEDSEMEDGTDKFIKRDKSTTKWKHNQNMKCDNSDFLTYAGIPIYNEDEQQESSLSESGDSDTNLSTLKEKSKLNEDDKSWTSYHWYCYHCKSKFKTMEVLRNHSKEVHNFCFGFQCWDCNDVVNSFNAFVEHVRQHRSYLRLYCQYCNSKFKSKTACETHSYTHWINEKVCELCGELLPDMDSLSRHTNLYKRIGVSRRTSNRRPPELIPGQEHLTWSEYHWTCQDCYMRVRDADSLREHVRSVHRKCYAMKCMDCLRALDNFRRFVAHVTSHRPHLKNYCHYCNAHIPDKEAMKQHLSDHENGPQRPCHGCGQIFENNALMSQHMKAYNSQRSGKNLTTEDLTCHICQKLFQTVGSLKSHINQHNATIKVHTCHICGKVYNSPSKLKYHLQTHNEKGYHCHICDKLFKTLNILKKHVATHSVDRPYVCNDCGKTYKLKEQLRRHVIVHSDFNPYKCSFCERKFKFVSNLKNHERQHTGARPYSCKVCDRTFSNFSNCDKHMKRKHGMTMAKTKYTAQGKLDINQDTGEVKQLVTNQDAQKWVDKLLVPERVKKKPKGKGKTKICQVSLRGDTT